MQARAGNPDFVPVAYFEVVATAKVAAGQFRIRHAPQDRSVRRELAEAVAKAAQGFEIITYPRAEVRYLPESLINDVPRIVAGLRVGQSFSAIPVPEPPDIRKGATGTFHDRGLEGASHHAVNCRDALTPWSDQR
jgi:DNA topoisomerase-3